MICAVFPLGLLAQQRTEYNRKGDEAMKRLDYSDAKMWLRGRRIAMRQHTVLIS